MGADPVLALEDRHADVRAAREQLARDGEPEDPRADHDDVARVHRAHRMPPAGAPAFTPPHDGAPAAAGPRAAAPAPRRGPRAARRRTRGGPPPRAPPPPPPPGPAAGRPPAPRAA